MQDYFDDKESRHENGFSALRFFCHGTISTSAHKHTRLQGASAAVTRDMPQDESYDLLAVRPLQPHILSGTHCASRRGTDFAHRSYQSVCGSSITRRILALLETPARSAASDKVAAAAAVVCLTALDKDEKKLEPPPPVCCCCGCCCGGCCCCC